MSAYLFHGWSLANAHIVCETEHDLRGSVVSCRYIASHLRILNPREAEVADFEITVLVDEDIRGFQITVYNAGGVYVFQTAL